MFKFLKDKLKKAVSKFSKSIEKEVVEIPVVKEEVKEEIKIEPKVEEKPKVEELKPEVKPKPKPEPVIEKPKAEVRPVEEVLEKLKPKIEAPKEKKSFFRRIKETVSKTSISEERFDKIFWELEIALMENNIAVEVIEKIKADLKKELVEEKISRIGIEDTIKNTLTRSIRELFDVDRIDLLNQIKAKREKPYTIAFIGINGVGKTTTLAKLGHFLKKNGLNVVIAAADTFRVAAIEQVEEHADKLGIKLVKQDYGSDSAAVCYDAIAHAKAKDMDVVLIDTAGRSHANTNLMDELKKVIKVAKPDLVVFVGDALTGNDAVEQAKEFQEAVGIDGIILAKADVDEKGGCAVSISYVTKKPIMFLGMGQGYDDLKEFSPDIVIDNLGLA
ncbi:MAG: signal recognition particle-docking protein FtsY [Nanoarchaeota archaeon]|nr:signal recognition particle-docking protein FtsY [Nanoarchaeota archaeon]